jgi:molecular chaperone GrpE
MIMESLEHETTSPPPAAGATGFETTGAHIATGEDAGELDRALGAERERRLRLLAEFDNYRRRSRRELEGAREAGRRDVLHALLEVADDFDRALTHVGDASDAVADGLRLSRRRLDEVLRSFGVTALACEGQAFDPAVHEAVSVVECATHEPGTVHAEVRRGYLFDGQLLRPARVTVARRVP